MLNQRLAIANRHFLATTAADLQALCDIQAMHAFLIRAFTGLAQLQWIMPAP